MTQIACAVVVYNTACQNSLSLSALARMPELSVYVADNSTREMGNQAYCQRMGWRYLPMGGNVGLPRAYNAVLGAIEEESVVVWLDDDTALEPAYFAALRAALDAHPEGDVFLPRVTDEAGQLSPCIIEGYRVRRCAPGQAPSPARITGINSGMAVRLRVYARYRYDEGYFLDYVDHAFLRDMKAQGRRIVPFEGHLTQRFSGNERGNAAGAQVRLRIFARDFSRFCQDTPAGRRYARRMLLRRRLVLCLRHRHPGFLWMRLDR